MGIDSTRLRADHGVPATAPGANAPRGERSGEDGQKRALRAFLMNRRARLKPGDVGLPETGRRRAPGLRREEVAELAGVSTAWYTMFEMAKETRVSRKTLDAIGAALRLSPSEQRHLAVLANALPPAPVETPAEAADPVLQAILDGYRAGPALLLNDRTDVLALNAPAAALFGRLDRAAGFGRNWLWLVLLGPWKIANRAEQARALAATYRANYCEHAREPGYQALLDELLAASAEFRQCWNEHDVAPLDDARPLEIEHPRYGLLRFSFRALPVARDSGGRVCFLIPDAATQTRPGYAALVGGSDATDASDRVPLP